MSDKRWKRHEREVAAALGTRRTLNTGYGLPDCIAHGFSIEVKQRATLPAWLLAAMSQSRRNAAAGTRAAVVLSTATQGRKATRLVLLTLEDFAALVSDGA